MGYYGTSGDVFCEFMVSRKAGSKELATKVLAAVIGVVLTVLALLTTFLLLPAVILIWVVVVFVIKLQKTEYEYSFTSGDLDIDILRGDMRRKRVFSMSITDAEIVAPEGSHELDSYMRGSYKAMDFSANDPEMKNYYIFATIDGEKKKILFTPNEKLLQNFKNYIPRQLKNY